MQGACLRALPDGSFLGDDMAKRNHSYNKKDRGHASTSSLLSPASCARRDRRTYFDEAMPLLPPARGPAIKLGLASLLLRCSSRKGAR